MCSQQLLQHHPTPAQGIKTTTLIDKGKCSHGELQEAHSRPIFLREFIGLEQ